MPFPLANRARKDKTELWAGSNPRRWKGQSASVNATDVGQIIDPRGLEGQLNGCLGSAGIDSAIDMHRLTEFFKEM